MKGIVNWYIDRKKQDNIKGKDGTKLMVFEKDIPLLTILNAGDSVEYGIKKTTEGIGAIKIEKIP